MGWEDKKKKKKVIVERVDGLISNVTTMFALWRNLKAKTEMPVVQRNLEYKDHLVLYNYQSSSLC